MTKIPSHTHGERALSLHSPWPACSGSQVSHPAPGGPGQTTVLPASSPHGQDTPLNPGLVFQGSERTRTRRLKRRMWGQALLLLLLLQHSNSDPACKNLRCFADYIRTLTCIWDAGAPRGKLHNLTATWDSGPGGSCAFLPIFRKASQVQFACSSEQKPCSFGNTFAVTVTTLVDGAPDGSQECRSFRCHENIRPQPPSNVTAVAHLGGYNISWESGYAAYDYLHGELQYQLLYRQKGHPWGPEGGVAGALKPVLQDTPTLWLSPQELEGGAEYELRVRAGLRDHSPYKGTWSEWSPSSRLRTPPRGPAGADWGALVPLLAVSLMVFTLAVFLCRLQRPWEKLEQLIPTPAPFFQPLYLVHKGDFKKWVGASCSRAPLAVSECGTALPEVLRMSPKPLPTTAAPEETPAPPCTAALPASTDDESPCSALEPTYGHLSIHTVTVADACGLQPADYHCLPLDGSPPEGLLLFCEMLPPRDSGSPGPRPEEACLAWPQSGALPERHWSTLRGLTRGVPASRPSSEEPFCYRKPLSPTWAADGDPGESLDLDTVDSGFADSDCGSPVDCEELQGRRASCAPPGEEEEEEEAAFLPSYVKQWVACHLPLAQHS